MKKNSSGFSSVMKLSLQALLVLSIVFSTAVYASETTQTEVAPGFILTEINDPSIPIRVFALEIDISRPEVYIQSVLANNVLGNGFVNTQNLALSHDAPNRTVVGAINGDYFGISDPSNPYSFVSNLMIMDGEYVNGKPYSRSQFIVAEDGSAFVDMLTFAGTAYLPDESTLAIDGVNRERSAEHAIVYNRFIGANTRTNEHGFEVLLQPMDDLKIGERVNFEVVAMEDMQGSMSFPYSSSYILSAHGSKRTILKDALSIGDTVGLELGTNVSRDDILHLMGGGPRLITDGVFPEVWHPLEGFAHSHNMNRHNRTAVGINQDGSKVIFMVIEGRQDASRGATMEETAQYIYDLGAWNAVNLDGGGSSTIIVNNTLINRPSGGTWQRPVANALLAVSLDSPEPEPVPEITNWHDLNAMRYDLSGSYTLMNDLHPFTEGYNTYNSGDGWLPIGNTSNRFAGTFDGNGHTISGLAINRSTANNGLFGATGNATISNLGLLDVNISTSAGAAAALVANLLNTTISDCYATGSIEKTGTASSANFGGLLGRVDGGEITQSWSSVNVSSGPNNNNAGGLAAFLTNGASLSASYSEGEIQGDGNRVGGLVGTIHLGSEINDSYSRANVSGNSNFTGGLVGTIWADTESVSNSYSTGTVAGAGNIGGLIGDNSGAAAAGATGGGSVTNSYWDTDASEMGSSDGGSGKTTAEMKTQNTFSGWDFDQTWALDESINDGYPHLPATVIEVPVDPDRITVIPYYEDFSAVTPPGFPPGWQTYGEVQTFNGWTAIGGTVIDYPAGISSAPARMAIMPEIDGEIDITNLELEFNVVATSTLGGEIIEVGFMSNPENPATFTVIETIEVTNEVEEHTVSLSGHSDVMGRRIALSADSPSDWNRFFIGFVKLTEETPVVYSETMEALPGRVELDQNYPNPFNPVTVISYALPRESYVRLAVYDVTGRKVALLAEEHHAPGRYEVNWDATNQASGIYIYRLEAGGEVLTRRMTLVK